MEHDRRVTWHCVIYEQQVWSLFCDYVLIRYLNEIKCSLEFVWPFYFLPVISNIATDKCNIPTWKGSSDINFRILAVAGKISVSRRRIFLPLLNPSTKLNGRVQGGRHSIQQLQVSVQRVSRAARWKAHREICVSLPSDISLWWRGRGTLGVSDTKPKHDLHLPRIFDLHRWRQQVSEAQWGN